jgi:hypothetical protein
MNKLFETWIICSKTIFSDSTAGCRRRKYGYPEKSKPDRIRNKKSFQTDISTGG